MSTTEALDNPLERLGILPNAMNWRGGWDATEQYYQNDVVVSPVNQGSYILSGKTALLDGGDPTTNPDWVELSSTSTGVLDVQTGAGITNFGTQTIPVLVNTGVRQIQPVIGGGIVVSGTPFNVQLATTAIQTITAGDAYIGVNTIGTTSSITNEGVQTVDTGNSGITVDNTDPKNPLILNDGVLTIASAGAGITVNNGTGPNPTIQNDGVLELTQGTGGISITGTKANYTISFAAPQPLFGMLVVDTNQSGGTVPIQAYTVSPFNSEFKLSIPTQPYQINQDITAGKAGSWLLDLSGVQFFNPDYQVINAPAPMEMYIADNGGNQYFIPAANGGVINIGWNSGSIRTYAVCNGGQAFIEPAVVKAAGLFGIREIGFRNNTGFDIWYTAYPSAVPCYYYPNGPQ